MRYISLALFIFFSILAISLLGVLAFSNSALDPWFFQPRAVLAQPLPAFYSGGLEKGSGGQPENAATAYDSKDLFAPSRAKNSLNALLPASAFPSPESCASCHADIHERWSSGAHAMSATDSTYLKVKELFAFDAGEPAVRLCASCHAPVALKIGRAHV